MIERRVVIAPGHPRGVRFIDGIDVPALRDAVRRVPGGACVEALAAQLGQPPGAVRDALHWMQAQRLA